MARLELKNVTIEFPLLQSHHRSFKHVISRPLSASRFSTDTRHRAVLRALQDVDLKIEDGDRVAIIGANGAGKSTLLRALAGIYPPVSGDVVIDGRVGALLTTGLGMRDDVSGYENIEFCLLLQGVARESIPAKRDEIAEFTELGEYLDLHVGAYSSGMRVRLAFAISTTLDPDILIIDEAFGASDVAFARKAEKRMRDLINRSKILVFASHAHALLEQFCDQAVWLENGRIRARGPLTQVNADYLASIS